jgi:hypothetical protein
MLQPDETESRDVDFEHSQLLFTFLPMQQPHLERRRRRVTAENSDDQKQASCRVFREPFRHQVHEQPDKKAGAHMDHEVPSENFFPIASRSMFRTLSGPLRRCRLQKLR